ncbi:VWA domain-containing protein [Alicyclobacillus sp. SO9]|uniref:VWA domain-containing protein n=1 Tax=Alicyclobacillus sp. SO9 TaxID=2665646 RepID=UPI0018E89CA0|nr:VWA domain-containing protein [Alicyclobacillus sp. SO9]QQE77745.1 VWA domain-containing protein [Alicyclobacillus sp. SO9]
MDSQARSDDESQSGVSHNENEVGNNEVSNNEVSNNEVENRQRDLSGLSEYGSAWASTREGGQLDRGFFQKPPRWTDNITGRTSSAFMSIPSRRPFLTAGIKRLDWSKTIKALAKAGNQGIKPQFRRSHRMPGRLVVLWDVSASMSDYFDLYLPWLHGLVGRRPNTGVFAFAAKMEDMTALLRGSHRDAANRLAELQGLFAGGTKIGVVVNRWIDIYGELWLRPPCRVVVISDGWDRGNPELAGTAFARIHKTGARVLWINPLAATPGFSPRTKTLLAAMPYLDGIESGHSPKTLLGLLRG